MTTNVQETDALALMTSVTNVPRQGTATSEDGFDNRKGSVRGLLVKDNRESGFDRRLYSSRINSDAVAVCREVNVVLDRIDHLSCLNPDDQFEIKVILRELLQNAIRHGNAMDKTKMIALDVTLDEKNTLEISVQDEGSGFDIERILAQKRGKAMDTEDVFNMDEFGRGLLIIENLCDTVCRNDRGNRVTVRKHIQHA